MDGEEPQEQIGEPQVRVWHDAGCPARDVTQRRIKGVCRCSPERWLDPWAVPGEAAEVATA